MTALSIDHIELIERAVRLGAFEPLVRPWTEPQEWAAWCRAARVLLSCHDTGADIGLAVYRCNRLHAGTIERADPDLARRGLRIV